MLACFLACLLAAFLLSFLPQPPTNILRSLTHTGLEHARVTRRRHAQRARLHAVCAPVVCALVQTLLADWSTHYLLTQWCTRYLQTRHKTCAHLLRAQRALEAGLIEVGLRHEDEPLYRHEHLCVFRCTSQVPCNSVSHVSVCPRCSSLLFLLLIFYYSNSTCYWCACLLCAVFFHKCLFVA
jgi:hypothetical protein